MSNNRSLAASKSRARDIRTGLKTCLSSWLLLIALLQSSVSLSAQVRLRTDEALDARAEALREEILGKDIEVFRLDCRNAHYRREVSLFGNGTIRIREGVVADPQMWLGELDRQTTSAMIALLQIPDLSEVPPSTRTVIGDWVESCEYTLDLPGEERQEFRFRRLDALQLPLQKSLGVAVTVLGMVDRSAPPEALARLPRDYVPQRGDVLSTVNGVEYRVTGFTSDRTAVELVGVTQPVVRFVAIRDLSSQFASVTIQPTNGR